MVPELPRVPIPHEVDLINKPRSIQVNHCRNPHCANYGVPARTEKQGPGPSPDRDMNYKTHSTSKGQVPSIRCKSCQNNPPLKSNAGIASEVARLIDAGGLRPKAETLCCRNSDCENHARPIALNRGRYHRVGRRPSGRGYYFQCKACRRKTLVSDSPPRIHRNNQALAVDIFGRIANKSPVRGTIRASGVNSASAYYTTVDFIGSRCRAHSGAFDRALIDGRLKLPESMVVESDAQEYTLNWESRLDRRNVVLSSYCTAHSDSGYILGMHLNFDGKTDPFAVHVESAQRGDMEVPAAFRRYSQYWLAGDELTSGRAMQGRVKKHGRLDLVRQMASIYASAEKRADVEDIELHTHDDGVLRTPYLKRGPQVHLPYTVYAHWILLRRILDGAGVKRLQANMDVDSSARAAFLCAFLDEIRRGDAHGFFVRYTKYQTIDTRKRILMKARAARARFAASLPPAVRRNDVEVARRIMRAGMDEARPYGPWDDRWVVHPFPTINEPHKAVSWLTALNSLDGEQKVDMFLAAGIARIDNVFMKTRRLFSALERPVGTSSGHNRVWHGYAPYNPGMVEKYLAIFRATHNFVFVGEDDRTPAMRLGFAKKPLDYEDILWPGERIPRRRRTRRKGKASGVAEVGRP